MCVGGWGVRRVEKSVGRFFWSCFWRRPVERLLRALLRTWHRAANAESAHITPELPPPLPPAHVQKHVENELAAQIEEPCSHEQSTPPPPTPLLQPEVAEGAADESVPQLSHVQRAR